MLKGHTKSGTRRVVALLLCMNLRRRSWREIEKKDILNQFQSNPGTSGCNNMNDNGNGHVVEITCQISQIEEEFMSLDLKQLKDLLKLKAETHSPLETQNLYESMSSADGIEEMRDLCRKYLQDYEMEALIQKMRSTGSNESHQSDQTQEQLHQLPQNGPLSSSKLESSKIALDAENDRKDSLSDDESCSSSEEKTQSSHKRNTAFRSILVATGLDDGSCLRGMLEKKTRKSFFTSWHERFWILNYSLLTLRYYKISR